MFPLTDFSCHINKNITGFSILIMIFAATALRIATLMFLFISRIRLPASDSLIKVLRNKHGRNLANEVRKNEKLYFNHKNRILDLDFLVSCRKKSVFPKLMQFKVFNKQLRPSQLCISFQKHLLYQEIDNKQKVVKLLQ